MVVACERGHGGMLGMFRGACAHPPCRPYAINRGLKSMHTSKYNNQHANRTFAQGAGSLHPVPPFYAQTELARRYEQGKCRVQVMRAQ